MYICTCLKCGNHYEDSNPGENSVEYPDNLDFPLLEKGEDKDGEGVSDHCPICLTDGHLIDNGLQVN